MLPFSTSLSSNAVSWAVGGLAMCLLIAAARPAEACGGLFCSSVNPTPVDQNAERILFEVDPDGSVTATVEIKYSGDPADFSWIIPVPETPTLGVSPISALALLDVSSAPRFVPPPTTCDDGGFSQGCGVPVGARLAQEDGAGLGGVTVEELPSVGPYDDIVVVSSDDPSALVDWLNENEYLVTAAMEPYMAEYVAEEYKFLAMRLAPDAGVSDIAPLQFTCPNAEPFIPLKLTAVAAEPEMALIVMIAGAERYQPRNYRGLTVDTQFVQWNPANQQFNYPAVVSWLLDDAGGKAFITELATDSSVVRDQLGNFFLGVSDEAESQEYAFDLLSRRPFFTRLYARMNPAEMDEDPVFGPGGFARVSGVHDLSDRPSVEVCGATPPRAPCGDTYCGSGALCATTADDVDGCVCPPGAVARSIAAPVVANVFTSGARTVTCQSEVDVLQDVPGIDARCQGRDCGAGSCVVIGGFPACRCADGTAAIPTAGDGVRCVAAEQTFEVTQLMWIEQTSPGVIACAAAGLGSVGTLGLWLSLVTLLRWHLRRKRLRP